MNLTEIIGSRLGTVRTLTSFKTSLKLSHPHLKMQQDIRILKQKCNAAVIPLCHGQVCWSWVHAPL